MLISASKGKSIKVWQLPKEWMDPLKMSEWEKEADITAIEKKRGLMEDLQKNKELDSDEDDLAGWHLD